MKGDTSPTLEQESKILLKQLQSQYEKIIQKVFYLQGFGYPVDHLNQRYLFDDYNSKEEKKYVQQANKMMFLRKLYEDGTFNSKNENSDLYLRTTLNTISIKLKSDGPWLNEDIRHDLEWAILRIDQLVRYGKTEQIQRVQNWINRIAKARQFYKNILDMKGTHKELQQFINKREAGKKLKDFVYKKNAEIYKSLLTQKEYIRAYFVFDQILLHEVGQASVANFRDRQDVAQVIINSRFNPKLSIIGENETLYSYLIEAGVDKDKMSNPSWLNAMFKGLRFSFTLYYIPSVKYLFCPDFYKTAKVTRSKNLHLIRNTLEAPRDNFKATRYFSRWSMLGRIDMSRVWSEYFQIPERTGAKYKSDAKLKRNFEAKNYRYLYSFEDPTKQIFHVLEMGSKTYTLKLINGKPSFFAYRDTHQFRYFQLLK